MSVTTFETITHVNIPPITETVGGELDIDEYGLDVLQRKFEVRPDSVELFLNTYPRGKEDGTYKWLYSMGPKLTDIRGPMVKATVVFKGARLANNSNIPPDPNAPRKESIKGGRQRQQVVLLSTLDLNAQKNVTYDAPWTEWRYITTTFPGDIGPAHTGEIVAKDKVAKVISFSGPQGDIVINPNIILPGQKPPVFTRFGFDGLLKVNNSKFDYEQVGRVWTVLERNELLVVDYATFLINQYFNW